MVSRLDELAVAASDIGSLGREPSPRALRAERWCSWGYPQLKPWPVRAFIGPGGASALGRGRMGHDLAAPIPGADDCGWWRRSGQPRASARRAAAFPEPGGATRLCLRRARQGRFARSRPAPLGSLDALDIKSLIKRTKADETSAVRICRCYFRRLLPQVARASPIVYRQQLPPPTTLRTSRGSIKR